MMPAAAGAVGVGVRENGADMTSPTAHGGTNLAYGSKADVAYEIILSKITDGTYGPGRPLVLSRLASEIGVSSVPVREALRRLEAEGYVDFKRNFGATVRDVDAAEYAETMQTLAILEASATALAATVAGPADLAAARQANEAIADSLEQLEPERYSQSNHAFHKALYAPCPNSYLFGVVEREWARLSRARNPSLTFIPERARQAVAEHTHLMNLIEQKADPAEIEEYAREHRMRTAKSFQQRYA